MERSGGDDRYPVDAPGWAAIDRALAGVFGDQVPHQFTSRTAYDLDAASPLPAIAVYEDTEPDHWMYVTFGLTELFSKDSPHAEISGFGYELTFRLPRDGDATPPTWPLRLLQGIGGHALSHEAQLDTGHLLALGAPLCPPDVSATRLTGLICVPDPALGQIDTPHGSLLFMTLFGLTDDELECIREWEAPRKVGLALEFEPRAVTRLQRVPMREDRRGAIVLRRYELGVLT